MARGARRLGRAAAIALVVALTAPAAAAATQVRLDGDRVVVDSGVLERNHWDARFRQSLTFPNGTGADAMFFVEEDNTGASFFSAGPGCASNGRTASCRARELSGGRLLLGSRDDVLTLTLEAPPTCFGTFGQPCSPDAPQPTVGPVPGFEVDASSGDDDLTVTSAGSDTIFGDSGADTIRTRDSVQDSVFCGRGTDNAVVDNKDGVAGDCENVVASHVREAPNVRVTGLRRAGGDRLAVRLACPRAASDGCAGKATLRRRGGERPRGLGARAYDRIAPGAARRVRIRLRAPVPAGARVRVTAVEAGVLGPKTTVATLRVPRGRG